MRIGLTIGLPTGDGLGPGPGGVVVPTPLSGTRWGLSAAESVRIRVALLAPAARGEKVTDTVQVSPGFTNEALQVSPVFAKSPMSGPAITAADMLREPLPLLVTVTGDETPDCPTPAAPKSSAVAPSDTAGW